ncbi:MAG: S49 family peptidase [Bacillales bacterium]|jgi:hypothetical protein|nr:S49 family peptidase [Bacillales bacterium]
MNYTQLDNYFVGIINPKIQAFLNSSIGIQIRQNQDILQQNVFSNIILPELNKLRSDKIKDLSNYTNRNTIVYYSGWLQAVRGNNDFSIVDNDMNGFMNAVCGLDKTKGLDLILHTPGGSIVATESIVSYLKKVFGKNIRVIVPHLAMSAGTMIACASKKIILGKQSSLGPIDPQYRGVSAEGVIEEFNLAVTDTLASPNKSLIWKEIIGKYAPTFVGECQKAIDLSKLLVTKWLKSNMFQNSKNQTHEVKKIMDEISSHASTKTHDRHFDCETCKHMGLKVYKLENNSVFQDLILTIHHSFVLSFNRFPEMIKVIENDSRQTLITTGQR